MLKGEWQTKIQNKINNNNNKEVHFDSVDIFNKTMNETPSDLQFSANTMKNRKYWIVARKHNKDAITSAFARTIFLEF